MKTNNTSPNKSNLQAGVAGAGGGTLILLLAKNLPDTNEYKSWLLIIAPSVAVGLSAFWKWLSNYIDNYLKRRKAEQLKDKLREESERALTSPHIPQDQKDIIKAKLAEFELQNIDTLSRAFASIEIE
ncbi:hypothetical protein ACFGVR_06200 [Mucilaginibacter sp. AW1-3]